MRFGFAILASALLSDAAVAAVALPATDVTLRQPIERSERDSQTYQDIWKRRGGGGGGGRGGGGSSGGGSSSGGGTSGGGSTGGGSSGGGSTGGGSTGGGSTGGGRGSPGSTTGGATKQGSGPPPAYGGGGFYGGGARRPYPARGPSPGGISPFLLGAGLGLAFWPGLWWHSAYMYPYHAPYGYYNRSANRNESRAVLCACDETVECGCDDDGNYTVVRELVGDGDYNKMNKSLVNVANVNGTDTILINGTLPAGTTAPGGDEDAFSAGIGLATLLQHAGWWPVVVTVGATVFLA